MVVVSLMVFVHFLRGARRSDLLLYALHQLRIWVNFDFLRLQPRTVVALLVGALHAGGAILHVRWELVVALMASVVWYRICSECISWVPVRVLVFLGTIILLACRHH